MSRLVGLGLATLVFFAAPFSSCAQGIITTVAGTTWIFRGAGGPAINAPLGAINGVAVDSAGNVYASDRDNNLVVKISPTGILSVIAGNGIAGFSGDGGSATSASLCGPDGIALDAAGNVFFADQCNQRVRKVTPAGIITTVAGNGNVGFSGDGGPATAASLNVATGVAVDAAGNVYVADRENSRVRRISPNGTITTVAGNGIRGFSGDGGPAVSASFIDPIGLALDGAGNLYITDTSSYRIRRVSASGTVTTVAGNGSQNPLGDNGPATSAGLVYPWGVTVDAAGNLYIAETIAKRIRKVSTSGIITTIAGTGTPGFSGDGGPATQAQLSDAQGIAVDQAGNLYVADTGNYRVRKISTAGTIATVAGNGLYRYSGDGGPSVSATLNGSTGIAVDPTNNLYIVTTASHVVRRVGPGGIISTVAGNGIGSFSGDGGPATSASLACPQGVTGDTSGNLYIADSCNHRIRRVNVAGTITTVVGNGSYGLRGDGGPATSASLAYPSTVAVDAAGNLYIADTYNQAVRKVSFLGIITTVAGNGVAGFSGDGGPAINAQLNQPQGVAVDAAGNVYIADAYNSRVRRVNPAGTITTVAGDGVARFSGDGGPASAASLGGSPRVTLDAAGNLYIADYGNSRIRKVKSDGTITTVAGGGFGGDGSLATSASLGGLNDVVFDSQGNLFISQSDRVREVLATVPSFSLSPASLSLSATAGVPGILSQQVTVSSTVTGLRWSAQASTATGGGWLAISPGSGATPGTISVGVNSAGLNPGTYQGTITVTAPLASPPVQTIAVQLTVTASQPTQLLVNAASLTFQAQGTANPPAQFLRIGNAGGGTLSWTAQASTQSGDNWLAVGPSSGSASAAFPASVQVTANAAGLAAGVYSGSVRISAAELDQTQTVTVTLLISQATQTILLSQSGLLFTGVENASAAPAQSFGILNAGQGTMNWTVEASTTSGGAWLSVSPSIGSTTANSLQIPLVDVRVNLRGLRAGQYSALIEVRATGANNSPQYVIVDLTVLPPGSNPGPEVRPTGLIFAAQAGGSSPGSQTVNVATPAVSSVEARSGLQTFDGVSWLEALPRNAVLSATDPRTITVQPSVGSLAPGVYRGALTLLFADGSPVQAVNILFLVVGGGQTASGPGAAAACVPQKLLAVHRSLGSSFVSPVARPTAIEVQVVDDCGNAAVNTTVVASFSNGDPPLPLASLGNGIYSGTWRPVNAASLVAVRVRADLAPLTTTEVIAQGQVTSNPTAPALFAAGLVNAANYASGAALPPGGIIAVFGRNLAVTGAANGLPLPTTLGGTTLSIGGVDVPLFYTSDGQINAQLPFELAPNTRPQAVARRSGVLAVPETITVAAVAPGIFTTNQQGSGQGAVLDSRGQLVDTVSPASAGDVVQVFCTGLGVTNPRVTSGQPSPSAEPLARTTATVTATVGGRPASVQFAGLAPGFVGLYQVNVQVPAGVAVGAEPLVLLVNGVPSNTVTLVLK